MYGCARACLWVQEPWKLTRNQELNIVHVKDARQFLASTQHRVVPGDTLVFDFVYFLHPVGRWVWSAPAAGASAARGAAAAAV